MGALWPPTSPQERHLHSGIGAPRLHCRDEAQPFAPQSSKSGHCKKALTVELLPRLQPGEDITTMTLTCWGGPGKLKHG